MELQISRLVNRSLGGFIKDVCIQRKRQKGAKWDREESRENRLTCNALVQLRKSKQSNQRRRKKEEEKKYKKERMQRRRTEPENKNKNNKDGQLADTTKIKSRKIKESL